jgi:hypothetical protein
LVKMAMSSPRVKIAVLHRTFRRDAGGAEAYAVAIALAMSESHDVHVFAQEMDNSLNAVTYHPIPLFFKRPRWLNQLWFALATWWLTRRGFDVVHSHENTWHGQVQTVHVVPMRTNRSMAPCPARPGAPIAIQSPSIAAASPNRSPGEAFGEVNDAEAPKAVPTWV